MSFATLTRQATKRRRMMTLWNQHTGFSIEFLAEHHDYVLYDVFHHIKALLLYPLNCSCDGLCQCEALRAKVVLSLNVDLYNQAQERQENPDLLSAMRFFFKIPDDGFFRKHYGEAYPIWLIQREFQEKEASNYFRIVDRLVWTLLRLAKTYELSLFEEPRASIKEAVGVILGKTPLKTKARKQEKVPYLCGEKAYGAQLKTYKSVCHFIAAFKFMEENDPSFSLDCPEKIRSFLSLSHWVRKKLLSFHTPNIKQKSSFSEEVLLSLPTWINSDDLQISLDPFEDKLQELNELWRN
jgi:hypothetical protein